MKVETKEPNSDPFSGFISSSYQNGELIQEKPPADGSGVPAGSAKPTSGAEDKSDDSGSVQADIKAAKEPAKTETGDEESLDESDDSDETEADKPAPKSPKRHFSDRYRQFKEKETTWAAEKTALEARLAVAERAKTSSEDSDEGELTEEKKPSKQAKEDKRPDPKDYEFGELDQKYLDDVVDYKVDQKLTAAEAKREVTRQQEAASAEQTRLKGRFDAMMAKGEEDFEDWELVQKLIDNETLSLSQDLIELILETEPEVGAKITHHLATNPKEARQIAGLPARGQAAYFGRLEARLSASAADKTPPEKAPEVPPPVKQPRGAGGKFGFDPATANFAEFEAGAKRVLKQS